MVILAACGMMSASALTLVAPSAVANLHATTPHWRVLALLGAIVAPTAIVAGTEIHSGSTAGVVLGFGRLPT
jgi:hypothetical protein